MVLLFLPFRDFSFIVDEDDLALLEALEEKKQEEKEEESEESSWPQYFENEANPLPELETADYWDNIPPPDLFNHELFLLPFLVLGFLLFFLAAVALFKPPLSLTKFNIILAIHGLILILIQVVCCYS